MEPEVVDAGPNETERRNLKGFFKTSIILTAINSISSLINIKLKKIYSVLRIQK